MARKRSVASEAIIGNAGIWNPTGQRLRLHNSADEAFAKLDVCIGVAARRVANFKSEGEALARRPTPYDPARGLFGRSDRATATLCVVPILVQKSRKFSKVISLPSSMISIWLRQKKSTRCRIGAIGIGA
jgi:hypothetical protein